VLAVGAVVLRHGRLLVIKRGNEPAKGLWSVPGGRLEFGETLAQAVVRELFEETGLVGTAGTLCGIAERMSPTGHVVIHDIWVDVEGEDDPVAGDDADEARFVGKAELTSLHCVPRLESFLIDHDVWRRMAP
jgi:8-oxo-dGTP diphosphatase